MSDLGEVKSGWIAWFTRNSVAANLLMVLIMISGIASYMGITKRMFPDFERNQITITVPFPGAAPEDVEQGIVLKVEEAIQDVDGIKHITSRASEGFADIRLEIDGEYDLSQVLDDVKMRVDAITTFPEEAEKPIIARQEPRNGVLWVSVYGDMDRRSRQNLAQQVRDEIAQLPSVSEVEVVGKRPYEISIELNPSQLLKYGLTFSEVANAVRRSSLDLPGGSIKTEGGDIRVRTLGQAYTGQAFADIVLRSASDGTMLRVGDVASVQDTFVESEEFSRFDGKQATSIRVSSKGEQNDLKIAADVREYVEKKRPFLPQGAGLDIWGDSSFYLAGRLHMMWSNLLQGAALVFLILTLFLRLRLAFWVMLGIPISFLGAFWLMPNLGPWSANINLLSLFAFILVLGIVVDDAIVIGESIYTTIKKNGQSENNVIRGALRVATPATFGVLTTVAAFAPTLFIDAGPSVFFRQVSIIVSLCLLFSLLESKLILPAHLAHMKFEPYDDRKANALARFQHAFRAGLEQFIERRYRPMIRALLKRRYVTMSAFVALFLASIGLVSGGVVRTEIFPRVPSDFIRVNLVMNDGTSIDRRNQVLDRIEQAARSINDAYAKTHPEEGGFLKHILMWTNGDSGGNAMLELTKSEQRSINAFEVEKLWRRAVGDVPGVKELRFFAGTNVGGGGADLAFKLTGSNYQQLEAAADLLQKRLREFDGVFDVRSSFSRGTQEIRLQLKPAAEALGLTQAELGRQVRQAFYGAEAQRIQRGRDELKVMVRYPKANRTSIGDLEDMKIISPEGGQIPLKAVADIEIGDAYSTIRREDRERAITVLADIDQNRTESGTIIREVYRNILPSILADFPGVKSGLTGASEEQEKLVAEFSKAFLISFFLIYALLAVPLKSYGQPLIVMSVIPFGIIGAIVGHWFFGFSLNMMSLFGLVALSGVVVNDSLLLVFFVNKARALGRSVLEAAEDAGAARFRAIILTSLTTAAGLLPIYFEKSLQAQFIIPMAISLGMGILFATVITLVLIPLLYAVLEDIKNLFRRPENQVDMSSDPSNTAAQHLH